MDEKVQLFVACRVEARHRMPALFFLWWSCNKHKCRCLLHLPAPLLMMSAITLFRCSYIIPTQKLHINADNKIIANEFDVGFKFWQPDILAALSFNCFPTDCPICETFQPVLKILLLENDVGIFRLRILSKIIRINRLKTFRSPARCLCCVIDSDEFQLSQF